MDIRILANFDLNIKTLYLSSGYGTKRVSIQHLRGKYDRFIEICEEAEDLFYLSYLYRQRARSACPLPVNLKPVIYANRNNREDCEVIQGVLKVLLLALYIGKKASNARTGKGEIRLRLSLKESARFKGET